MRLIYPDRTVTDPLLSVRDLRILFDTDAGQALAVDGLSFDVHAGEAVGLVGESGCGKSVTALSLLRLVPEPPGRYAGGSILLRGQDLLGATERELRSVRGGEIGLVFQEPAAALDPVFTIGDQVAEGVRAHAPVTRREARSRAVELLDSVGLEDAARRARDYPHQLSGGMRQRAMIAVALAGDPALVVADEPTTALDVTLVAQILGLLETIRHERGTALLLVSHDLDVVASRVDRVLVMYAGRLVEEAPADQLFQRAAHPYTRGLLASRPRLSAGRGGRLPTIPGRPPDPAAHPPGCRFHPRCEHAIDRCRTEVPELRPGGESGRAACHRLGELP